ncbi:hypothetical protein GCM10011390_35380 [Aureimonas endophytica]|uniref:Uncharacterized protein n=1 Tax=Aureimonas endophytica TaxID=2027858 RepID=A0A917E7Q7_9HYPH|nr:DUF1289 domain-containing protein [Aureimonas endophytica]GGE13227.1 hypothetical protein GCM10011390_35380 [Aureimonas endophytica]
MAKTWAKAPSPCISVCKFRDEGRCIGCQMTKPEKKRFKRLKGKAERRPFFEMLRERLVARDRYAYWSRMYRRRCLKKAADCPLDKLEQPDGLDRAA